MKKQIILICVLAACAMYGYVYVNAGRADGQEQIAEKNTRESQIENFSCRGNEPFWNLRVTGDRAEFSQLGADPESKNIRLKGDLNRLDFRQPPLYVWRGRAKSTPGDMVAFIAKETCLDTMSDQEGQSRYAYSILISMPDNQTRLGCCNETSDPPVQSADPDIFPVADPKKLPKDAWAHYLPELLPAINACVAHMDEARVWITKAWPMNKGMVGLRLRRYGGGWWQCTAAQDGLKVDRFQSLLPTERPLPGEGMILFTPIGKSLPAGECYQHERVLGAEGSVVGWLSFNTC
jgi:uncharacterized membrane protein